MTKCQFCQKKTNADKGAKRDAVWAMQFIAEDVPTFSKLGWHYRGFKAYPVCEEHYRQLEGHTFSEIQETVNGTAAAAAKVD
jgi:hypothetical protein